MEAEWDQLELWENERIRAEVWLDTSSGGWLWHVVHRDGQMNWVIVDSGICNSPQRAYRQVSLVLDQLEGF